MFFFDVHELKENANTRQTWSGISINFTAI